MIRAFRSHSLPTLWGFGRFDSPVKGFYLDLGHWTIELVWGGK